MSEGAEAHTARLCEGFMGRLILLADSMSKNAMVVHGKFAVMVVRIEHERTGLRPRNNAM